MDRALHVDNPDADQVIRQVLVKYGIPPSLHGGIVRYLVDGIRPGSFLSAVLENNLAEAVIRANPTENFLALPKLVEFFYNEASSEAWGERARVDAWILERRERRKER